MHLFFPLSPMKSDPILKKTSVCCRAVCLRSDFPGEVRVWSPQNWGHSVECCVCLGLLRKSVLSSAEFTLGRVGTVQDQLSLPHSPSDSHLLGSSSQGCVADAESPSGAPSPGRAERAGQAASQGALPLPGICWKPEKARGESFFASSWLI